LGAPGKALWMKRRQDSARTAAAPPELRRFKITLLRLQGVKKHFAGCIKDLIKCPVGQSAPICSF